MEKNFTEGSLIKALATFSLPYLLSCFLQTFYGMVDLFVVGQYNGAASISAVSIGSQVMHMVTVIIVGLAMGSTVCISHAIGRKEEDGARKAIGNTVVLFIVFSVLLTIVLLFLVGPIVSLLSTPAEAVAETKRYLTICFIGIPLITAYNIISCIFRGVGDSRNPTIFVAIACVINIVLDFVFIGPFHMGAAGAAYATVIAQGCSVAASLIMIRCRHLLSFSFHRGDFVPRASVMKRIIRIGIPIACQDGFVQVSFLIITAIANSRGVTAAASVGIVEKIISFLFLVPSAMLASVSAIAAQNVGAGNHARARTTLRYALTVTVSFGVVVTIFFQFFAPQVIGLFTSDQAVVAMGAQYIHSYVFDCIAAGIHFCFSGFFCAYGRSSLSFIQNFSSIILVRIPGAFLASSMFPDTLFPMGMAAPLGSVLSSIICVILFVRIKWEKIQPAEQNPTG